MLRRDDRVANGRTRSVRHCACGVPADALYVPDGHAVQLPGEDPPQPPRYCPRAQDAGTQGVHTAAQGQDIYQLPEITTAIKSLTVAQEPHHLAVFVTSLLLGSVRAELSGL